MMSYDGFSTRWLETLSCYGVRRVRGRFDYEYGVLIYKNSFSRGSYESLPWIGVHAKGWAVSRLATKWI